jgi:hypothetical protein
MFGTAITWGGLWMAGAFPLFLGLLRELPFSMWLSISAEGALLGGFAGAATGATYSLLVMAFERHGTLAGFRGRRAMLLGGTAGAGFALVTVAGFLNAIGAPAAVTSGSVIAGAMLGGATAGLTLIGARRAIGPADEAPLAEISSHST